MLRKVLDSNWASEEGDGDKMASKMEMLCEDVGVRSWVVVV